MRQQSIRQAEGLPRGRFRLWRLSFADCADFGDRDLSELQERGKGITTVTNLNLAGTSVGPSGLDGLKWLSGSLRNLNPGGGILRPEDLAQLAGMLPDCKMVGH